MNTDIILWHEPLWPEQNLQCCSGQDGDHVVRLIEKARYRERRSFILATVVKGKIADLLLSLSSRAALDGLVQAFHKGLIEPVRGHVGGNASSDGEAEEVEVSDEV